MPQVPDEKDSCVKRLMEQLQSREGIVKVHLTENKKNGPPVLCFHYNSEVISLDRIRALAKNTGAEITDKFGHLLLKVKGIRHIRQARLIEQVLSKIEGVLEESVSGSGLIRLEFEKASW